MTTASRKGRGWVINGRNASSPTGTGAAMPALCRPTDKGLSEGSTLLHYRARAPGFTTGHVEDKMVRRLANNAELIFDSCFVPDEDCLGAVIAGST